MHAVAALSDTNPSEATDDLYGIEYDVCCKRLMNVCLST